MSGDSQASFSQSVRNSIHRKYRLRCVICLDYTSTIQCAHIIDAATPGQKQLHNAVALGILPADYQSNAPRNGMLQCPTCHAYFTQNSLALSLPIPVLKYVHDYVRCTPKATRKPLHEVFDLLMEASQGIPVELPDPKATFPYLGLFTLVTLNPTRVIGNRIFMPFTPPLSIIHGNKFVEAPSNTSPTSENVARIFESLALVDDSPLNLGMIPISPDDPAFKEQRYWRIPVLSAPIFAALVERLHYDSSGCQDIRLARIIYNILDLQRLNGYPLDDNDGGGGPSGGGGGPSGGSGPNDDNEGGGGPSRGGGPSGGGRGSSKRKGGKNSTSPRKGAKKARKMSGGSGTRACGESASPTCIPDDGDAPVHLISTGWDDDSDSEHGRSVSAQIPHDEDNPAEWQFGPSFSTNKIVFIARGINLT
ncbi:hypothetical protein BYT27DRAFT_6959794 [Phlegmacium glaucopus]|nr:hypothetical protein BYT27DRAFT_6959794 [Phlegmacium glaucopus]